MKRMHIDNLSNNNGVSVNVTLDYESNIVLKLI